MWNTLENALKYGLKGANGGKVWSIKFESMSESANGKPINVF